MHQGRQQIMAVVDIYGGSQLIEDLSQLVSLLLCLCLSNEKKKELINFLKDGPSTYTPITNVGDQDEAPGALHQPGP